MWMQKFLSTEHIYAGKTATLKYYILIVLGFYGK